LRAGSVTRVKAAYFYAAGGAHVIKEVAGDHVERRDAAALIALPRDIDVIQINQSNRRAGRRRRDY